MGIAGSVGGGQCRSDVRVGEWCAEASIASPRRGSEAWVMPSRAAILCAQEFPGTAEDHVDIDRKVEIGGETLSPGIVTLREVR
jgi:hypothetical protein